MWSVVNLCLFCNYWERLEVDVAEICSWKNVNKYAWNGVRRGGNLSCHVLCGVADVRLFVWSHWHRSQCSQASIYISPLTLSSSLSSCVKSTEGAKHKMIPKFRLIIVVVVVIILTQAFHIGVNTELQESSMVNIKYWGRTFSFQAPLLLLMHL